MMMTDGRLSSFFFSLFSLSVVLIYFFSRLGIVGVHDNLDPQILGKLPRDISPEYERVDNWDKFPSESEAEAAKIKFMKKFLAEEIIGGGEEERKQKLKVCSFAVGGEEEIYSPAAITSKLIKHCLEITGKSRQWMEQNPRDKLPNDYVQYPGKMDHTTCLTIRVGDYEQALLRFAKEKKTAASGRALD
jgi:hypothetical protein